MIAPTERPPRRPRTFDPFYDPFVTILLRPEFDEPQPEEIEAISAEIGATGARRPASE